MSDLIATMPITAEAVWSNDVLRMAVNELRRTRAARLEEVGLEPEEEFDLVLLAVPKGRCVNVAQNLVNSGFTHGDVMAEAPEGADLKT